MSVETRPGGGLAPLALLAAASLIAAAPAPSVAEPTPPATSPSIERTDAEGEAARRLGPARAAERDRLFQALRQAPRELDARAIEDRIWRFWFIAPSPQAEALMDRAMRRIRVADYEDALAALDALVDAAPHWAEAWNQRAFAHFLMERHDRSLEDALKALALEPRHFGALSGQALIFIRQGRAALARDALEKATALNPFLKERHLLDRLRPKQGAPI